MSDTSDGLGRVRLSDDNMKGAGLRRGDLALIELGKGPRPGGLCAALTPWGELVVRRFRRKQNGDTCLYTGAKGETKWVFTRAALVILGRVVRVEKGGGR